MGLRAHHRRGPSQCDRDVRQSRNDTYTIQQSEANYLRNLRVALQIRYPNFKDIPDLEGAIMHMFRFRTSYYDIHSLDTRHHKILFPNQPRVPRGSFLSKRQRNLQHLRVITTFEAKY